MIKEIKNGIGSTIRIQIREFETFDISNSSKNKEACKNLLQKVAETIDSLFSGFFSNLNIDIEIHCSACKKPSFDYNFVVNEFANSGKNSFVCQLCKCESKLDEISPDLAFQHLKIITDLETLGYLGKGGLNQINFILQ